MHIDVILSKLSSKTRNKIFSLLKGFDSYKAVNLFEHLDLLNNLGKIPDSDAKIIQKFIQAKKQFVALKPSTDLETLHNSLLSKRAIDTLSYLADIHTIADLLKMPEDQGSARDLLRSPWVGQKTIDEIYEFATYLREKGSIQIRKSVIQHKIMNYKAAIAGLENEIKKLELQQTLLTNGDNQK